MTSAIIVASGSSRRMGFDKLMAPLAGKTVLDHSLAAFAACPDIAEIILVTDPDRFRSLDLLGLEEKSSASTAEQNVKTPSPTASPPSPPTATSLPSTTEPAPSSPPRPSPSPSTPPPCTEPPPSPTPSPKP